MKIISAHIVTIFCLIIFFLNSGCHTFYSKKTKEISSKNSTSIEHKNTVIHYFDSGKMMVMLISDARVDKDSIRFASKENFESKENLSYYYEKSKVEKNFRVKRNHYKSYAKQAHFFLGNNIPQENSFALSDIKKIEMVGVNGARTTLSYLSPWIVAGGSIGLLLAVACNCPHAYTFDGNQYHYNNTLFTGATGPNIERDDYKLMPDYTPSSESYKIIIKNEDKESQMINLMELMVVEHEFKTEVYTTQEGKVFAASNIQIPETATDDNGADISNLVSVKDNSGYHFNNVSPDDFSNVYAKFKYINKRENAKLILKVKNDNWGAFVFKEFSSLFGKNHKRWVKNNHKKSKEEVYAGMKKTGIPLMISVKKDDKWIDIEDINLIGDINYNTIIVPIDSELISNENIEIRVRSGFMFWDLDYLGLDFSPNQKLNISYIKPSVAFKNNSINLTREVSFNDSEYLTHEVTGDSTYVEFNSLKSSSYKARSIILHSKGYYLPKVEYSGKPNMRELIKFKKAGEMSRFSRKLYFQYFGNLALQSK